MIKHRKFLLLTSILGLILLVFPWMTSSYDIDTGLSVLGWKTGPIYILAFVANIIISLKGDRSGGIDSKHKIFATLISVFAFIVILFRIIYMADFLDGIAQLTVVSSLALIMLSSAPISFLVVWFFKNPNEK